jgi:hypothetical protein
MRPEWKTIEKYAHAFEASALKSFLEGHGIPCVVLGLHVVQTHPLFHDPIEVQVPSHRLDEAKILIEECRKEESIFSQEREKKEEEN